MIRFGHDHDKTCMFDKQATAAWGNVGSEALCACAHCGCCACCCCCAIAARGQDEVLFSLAEDVKNFAVVYLVDIAEVPDLSVGTRGRCEREQKSEQRSRALC